VPSIPIARLPLQFKSHQTLEKGKRKKERNISESRGKKKKMFRLAKRRSGL